MFSGTHSKLDEMTRECIRECQSCHSICLETVTHCLEMGGKHADPTHIRLLMDCANICTTSADFMLRNSDLHPITCGACAEVCERCAQSCEQMDPNDPVMQQCAAACRSCAQSCRRMSNM